MDIFVDIFRLADIFTDEPQLGSKNQVKNQKQQDSKIVKQIKSFSDELKHSGTIDFILSDKRGTLVLSVLSEEMLEKMFSGLKNSDTEQFNLPELVTKITGPAAIVIPVAIYA